MTICGAELGAASGGWGWGGEYLIRACANENIHTCLKGCGSICACFFI